ncbi:MAG: hypothetical protein JWM86_969 [Thermoleophilia bacterium]|nr:hypothetical protein [Thermoleophilia bacterium]
MHPVAAAWPFLQAIASALMSLPAIDPTDIDALLTRVLELSVPLHSTIEAFDEEGASYVLEGAPGVAFFQRDAGDTIGHVSGSPSPALMPPLDDLRRRHLAAVGAADDVDNSHLPALLLLCTYLADPETSRKLGLDSVVRQRAAQIRPLEEEEGQHDPDLQPLDAALRAWVPLRAAHLPDVDETWPAILEFVFPSDRYTRHVPWEGAAGETAQLPSAHQH